MNALGASPVSSCSGSRQVSSEECKGHALSCCALVWIFMLTMRACQARVAQDSLIWKPPGAGPVSYHQDAPYISAQFIPFQNNSITIWCALDDADEETGVVEYARGSHLWPWQRQRAIASSDDPVDQHVAAAEASFHGATGAAYRIPLQRACAAAGLREPDVEIVRLKVPSGFSSPCLGVCCRSISLSLSLSLSPAPPPHAQHPLHARALFSLDQP